MGQRIIITEEEKKNILSLYEQTDDLYKKENDFLKKYIGKTYNVYIDSKFTQLSGQLKVNKIEYLNFRGKDGLMINYDNDKNYQFIVCNYNPSKIGYLIDHRVNIGGFSVDKIHYTKAMIDDINNKGVALGIQWCKKPSADFGAVQKNKTSNIA